MLVVTPDLTSPAEVLTGTVADITTPISLMLGRKGHPLTLTTF